MFIDQYFSREPSYIAKPAKETSQSWSATGKLPPRETIKDVYINVLGPLKDIELRHPPSENKNRK